MFDNLSDKELIKKCRSRVTGLALASAWGTSHDAELLNALCDRLEKCSDGEMVNAVASKVIS